MAPYSDSSLEEGGTDPSDGRLQYLHHTAHISGQDVYTSH